MDNVNDAILTPEKFISYAAKENKLDIKDIGVSPVVVVSWAKRVIIDLAKSVNAAFSIGWSLISGGFICYKGQVGNKNVSFVHVPEGAPATIAAIENMIACGAKTIIGIGWAGSLSKDVRTGTVIIPVGCISEEGTSAHYLDRETEIHPDMKLVEIFNTYAQLCNYHVVTGVVWTTDAIYRELNGKVRNYRENGVLGVDMETSAMYSLGMFRNVSVCNLLTVSDELYDTWVPSFNSMEFQNGINRVKHLVLSALKDINPEK